MPTHLDPVLTSRQIADAVLEFNAAADHHSERVRRLISGTTYWVYDSTTRQFGPSKFVGFAGMDFDRYETAISGDWTGSSFNGTFTRERIEQVLDNSYEENERLQQQLIQWASALGYESIFDNVDTNKLKFLELQSGELTTQRTVRPLNLYSEYSRCEVRDIFAPEAPCTPQRGTWGLHGIVNVPDRPGDYVFFVTFGQSQAGHDFDESITEEGVLSWQSQPSQDLQNKRINHFINHDELRNSIYLFLRPNRDLPYTYLGTLKYLEHDPTRERPVYFYWQIQEWDRSNVPTDSMGLTLSESGITEPLPAKTESAGLSLTAPPAPKATKRRTRSFTATKGIDYSGNDARNKQIGLAGEKLVMRYEQETLFAAGRADLALKVKHVSVEEGDGAGYDIRSYTLDGNQKSIEVKTTTSGPKADFYLSPNEQEFYVSHPEEFYLYRVYSFDPITNTGMAYVLQGDITDQLSLRPTGYQARLSGDQDAETSDL